MTIKTRATVGADGMVHVNLRVGEAHAGEEVEVVVARPGELVVSDSSIACPPGFRKMNPEEWRQFIERTAGAIEDPDFCRPPSGPPQDREPIFD